MPSPTLSTQIRQYQQFTKEPDNSPSDSTTVDMAQLVELDALEILVIVDNELDPFSPCSNESVKQSGGVMDIAMRPSSQFSSESMGTYQELRMDNICCSAHGLSMMITGIKDSKRHTVLFDAGPEGEAWEKNANCLQAEIGDIEVMTLSHWHRDHSGGMPRALEMIQADRKKKGQVDTPLLVDLHPDRPDFRGIRIPGLPVISLEADPTFEEFEKRQGVVDKRSLPHTILDDTFLISGEIPRVTEYESGFKFGVRFDTEAGRWVDDEDILDERILVCKLKSESLRTLK